MIKYLMNSIFIVSAIYVLAELFYQLQFSVDSTMPRIWIIACLLSVACCCLAESSECPISLENKITLKGIWDEDIVSCFIHVFECASGSLALQHLFCSLAGVFMVIDATPNNYPGKYVGQIDILFTPNLTRYDGLMRDLDDSSTFSFWKAQPTNPFKLIFYTDMKNIIGIKLDRGKFTQEKVIVMQEQITAIIPKMFNHDPLYQMQLYRNSNPVTLKDYDLTHVPEGILVLL